MLPYALRYDRWDLTDKNPEIRKEMDREGLTLSKVLQILVKRVREALEMKRTFRSGNLMGSDTDDC